MVGSVLWLIFQTCFCPTNCTAFLPFDLLACISSRRNKRMLIEVRFNARTAAGRNVRWLAAVLLLRRDRQADAQTSRRCVTLSAVDAASVVIHKTASPPRRNLLIAGRPTTPPHKPRILTICRYHVNTGQTMVTKTISTRSSKIRCIQHLQHFATNEKKVTRRDGTDRQNGPERHKSYSPDGASVHCRLMPGSLGSREPAAQLRFIRCRNIITISRVLQSL